MRCRGSACGKREALSERRCLEHGVVLETARPWAKRVRNGHGELTAAVASPCLELELLERAAAAETPYEDGAACVTAGIGVLEVARRAVDVVREVDRLA